jgi:hypothetical protein
VDLRKVDNENGRCIEQALLLLLLLLLSSSSLSFTSRSAFNLCAALLSLEFQMSCFSENVATFLVAERAQKIFGNGSRHFLNESMRTGGNAN